MEGLLFLGLMGSGYVYNNMSKDHNLNTDKGGDKKPVVSSPELPDITQRTSVYARDSTLNKPQYIKNQNNQVSQFKQFNLDTTQAIQKLNSPIEVTQPEKIQSEISDDYIDRMDFLTNDQGIRIQPHFKGSGPGLSNINNNGMLESTQGYDIKMKKIGSCSFLLLRLKMLEMCMDLHLMVPLQTNIDMISINTVKMIWHSNNNVYHPLITNQVSIKKYPVCIQTDARHKILEP